MMRVRTAVSAGALLVMSSGVLGQVFPPPGPQQERGPAVKPPPPQPITINQTPAGKKKPQPRADVPDLDYVSLVEHDEEGHVIRLEGENLDLLALKHNPLVTAETIEAMEEAALAWRERVDRLVITYADIIMDIETGYFDDLDPQNEPQVVMATEVAKALIGPGKLTNAMRNEGLLTKEQVAFNQKIVMDYTQALAKEEQAKLEASGETVSPQMAVRMLFTQLCADALWSLERQLTDVARRAGEVLPAAGMSSRDTARWQQELSASMNRAETIKKLFGELDYEQQAAILNAAKESREPGMPELEAAKVKPEGTQTPPEDSGSSE